MGQVVEDILAQHNQVDILINNAGSFPVGIQQF
jgi:NADP-dependent 3-hydroxy acid dehydrogenase YdfG